MAADFTADFTPDYFRHGHGFDALYSLDMRA